MPPRAAASSTKRKASSKNDYKEEDSEDDVNGAAIVGEEDADEDDSRPKGKASKSNGSKKAKVQKEPVKPLDPSLPTNITFPINLTLEAKAEGTTRLANWNVCGINSCVKKGFDFYVKAENPDVLVVTETKLDKEFDNDTLKARYPVSSKCLVSAVWLTEALRLLVSVLGCRPKERTIRYRGILKNKAETSCHGSANFERSNDTR